MFLPIPPVRRNVSRQLIAGKLLTRAIRRLKTAMIILVMRLDLRNKQKKWFLPVILVEVMYRIVVYCIRTVTDKLAFFSFIIKHISIVSMGGRL